jgi:nucleotide-binding universal stress UspA family protein
MAGSVIIVGTDGSESSMAAVGWAAREAQRRGLPLRVVHAFDEDRRLADAVVALARDGAREVAPRADISTDIIAGPAVQRLLEAARGAALLVVGSRGRSGVTGLLLGSVSQRLATHAGCPVVVVRGHAGPDRPVVAGVDETRAADTVLAAAFETAARRGCRLTVVHSPLPPVLLRPGGAPPASVIVHPEGDTSERARLEQRLAPLRRRYPGVPVEGLLAQDGAASSLVEASRSAQLVVVGAGHSGTVAGAVLGSTVTHLLRHADCPVMIAHQGVQT